MHAADYILIELIRQIFDIEIPSNFTHCLIKSFLTKRCWGCVIGKNYLVVSVVIDSTAMKLEERR